MDFSGSQGESPKIPETKVFAISEGSASSQNEKSPRTRWKIKTTRERTRSSEQNENTHQCRNGGSEQTRENRKMRDEIPKVPDNGAARKRGHYKCKGTSAGGSALERARPQVGPLCNFM